MLSVRDGCGRGLSPPVDNSISALICGMGMGVGPWGVSRVESAREWRASAAYIFTWERGSVVAVRIRSQLQSPAHCNRGRNDAPRSMLPVTAELALLRPSLRCVRPTAVVAAAAVTCTSVFIIAAFSRGASEQATTNEGGRRSPLPRRSRPPSLLPLPLALEHFFHPNVRHVSLLNGAT